MSIERYETYKTFAGFRYHLNFPDEWILNELPHTGRECCNCVGNRDKGDYDGFAMWRGIILGYCANCADDYEGKRGRGFMGFGNELPMFTLPSAFTLYLGDVDFENYGDLADNEEHTVENKMEEQADLIMDYYNDDDEEEEEESENEYYPDEDDFGECLKIGCGKASATYSAYCAHHAEMYDK
jgi:hypothetical protein